jgi:tetratricopeptide (TPR) repeat protein
MRVLDRFVICIFVLIALSTLFPSACRACLWDDDTLRTEARGLPGLAEILTGRIERNPPLYYQMRLERVTAQLAADPDNLAAYDNAAVACDRLGRSDEAIEWMARKRAALNRNPDSEHEYRYLANLGTFHAHRWIRTGADPEDMADLEIARDLISDAIELNPDAHFGREKYQLMAIRWILDAPDLEGLPGRPNFLSLADPDLRRNNRVQLDEAIEGISGLIVLGNAWESIDVMEALAFALGYRSHGNLTVLALSRSQELADQGMTSFHPQWEPQYKNPYVIPTPREDGQLKSWFTKARAEADTWRAAREQYMIAKLEAGEHPDTHADFWDDWVSPSRPPPMPNGFFGYQGTALLFLVLKLVAIVPFAIAISAYVVSRRRARRRQLATAHS